MLAASASEPEIVAAQASLLERTADDLRDAASRAATAGAEHPEVLVTRSFLRMTPEAATRFRAATAGLANQYAEQSSDGDLYEIATAFFLTEGAQ